MIVLDTHAWIWWVADPRRYFSATLRKILKGVGMPVPFGDDRKS